MVFGVLGWWRVNAREFHREAIETLNDNTPWNLKRFIKRHVRKKKKKVASQPL